MKTPDPSAYTDLILIDTTNTSTPLNKPFRGLLLTTTASSTIVFHITTNANVVRSDMTFGVLGNQTMLIPISGNNIEWVSNTTGTWYVYAVI